MNGIEMWNPNSNKTLHLHRRGTYIKARNNHIFLGFTKGDSDIVKYICNVKQGRLVVHIFITNTYDLTEDLHNSVINITNHPHSKVILHCPKLLPDIKTLMDDMFSDVDGKLLIISEKVGPTFALGGGGDQYYLDITYDKHYAKASVVVTGTYMMQNYKDCAIQNLAQSSKPELFKDRIISNFKAGTPLSILKNFKDEDDIWDYVTEQSCGTITITAQKEGLTDDVLKDTIISALTAAGFNVIANGEA